MTRREEMAMCGHGLLQTAEGLRVRVKVEDAKTVYGQDRLLVSPVDGSGQAWVSVDRVIR